MDLNHRPRGYESQKAKKPAAGHTATALLCSIMRCGKLIGINLVGAFTDICGTAPSVTDYYRLQKNPFILCNSHLHAAYERI